MRAGWIGLGKVGLPCALALAVRGGHQVAGYDRSSLPGRILTGDAPPPREEGLEELIAQSYENFRLAPSVPDLVAACDLVVIAVQTPHLPGYGGEQPAPGPPRDYEYGFLAAAVREVAAAARDQRRDVTAVVASTTLPGTVNRVIAPLAGPRVRLVYSPVFISLGTTIRDFCDPGFVLAGAARPQDADALGELYGTLHGAPLLRCDFTTAELAKVAVNMHVTLQVTAANWLAELADRTGADAGQVTETLARSGASRIRDPGMGEGGPCRPRDLSALSWLAGRAGMSHDLAAGLIAARQAHAEWLAGLARDQAALAGLDIVILGTAYKPGTDLADGSPALLLAHCLSGPAIPGAVPVNRVNGKRGPAVYVIATRHPEYAGQAWPPGSAVIDPWGYIPDAPGVTVVRPGRR